MNIVDAKAIAARVNVGFWRVQDQCYFSKTEALREASIKGCSVKYWYFDETFRSLGSEPVASIDELYEDRARAIRDRYEYVSIAASGGADSTNLIQAFLRAGLQIDEIITYYPVQTIEKLNDAFDRTTNAQNLIFEYDLAFKPLAERVQHVSPKTKITVLDHSVDAMNIVASGALNNSFHDISRTPNFVGVLKLVQYIKEANHRNACVLVGSDKPVILYDVQTGVCFAVFDDFTNALNLANLEGSITVEPFYFTKDAPSILQKQFNIVKRAVQEYMRAGDFNDLVSKRSSDLRFRALDMKHPFLERAIYPSLWPIKFQAQKPLYTFFNESGSWLFHERFKNETRVDIASAWRSQINEFVFGIDPRFIEYKSGLPVKFKPCPSSWFTFQ